MSNIQTNRDTFIRRPLDDLDEDKIVFYDIETDHQYPVYAKMKMCSVGYGLKSKPVTLRTKQDWQEFRRKARAPDVLKFGYNDVNFDRIVLHLAGEPIHPQNAHDGFQMIKTIAPNLPAYGLKFVNFYYLGDPDFAQFHLKQYQQEHGCEMHEVPREVLARYNRYDIKQTRNAVRLSWDHIIKDEHWPAYMKRLLMYEPLLEMETEGGLYIHKKHTWVRLQRLQRRIQKLTNKAIKLTGGAVRNPNSSAQLGKYFHEHDKLELALTDNGEFCVDKRVLQNLKNENPLAKIAAKIRETHGTSKYYQNYLHALDDTRFAETHGDNWIPVQFSVGSAKTRRFTSQSLYRINFQNPNHEAEEVQLIPKGFLGFTFDATQVENVVHIFESKDRARRREYENDVDWNEYVWLCNRILGTNKTKDELDDIDTHPSPQVPNWTIYKHYKSGKLGLNFGMGVALFCEMFGLSPSVGFETFQDIHRACPAIRELQERVAYDLRRNGYVSDVFGERYSGPVRLAYKVVAYLVQGCGTGSLPQAQIRANWETFRSFDRYMPKSHSKCGVLSVTTHDSNDGFINLKLGARRIIRMLEKMNYNMTERFSPLFDNIPLRAKLYLSRTTKADKEEINITNHKAIEDYVTRRNP